MIRAFFRLVKFWLTGRYRILPWRSVALFGVLLLYVFSPIDVIPDYIPFLGYIDDLALLGFFLRSLQKDVVAFAEWERNRPVSKQLST